MRRRPWAKRWLGVSSALLLASALPGCTGAGAANGKASLINPTQSPQDGEPAATIPSGQAVGAAQPRNPAPSKSPPIADLPINLRPEAASISLLPLGEGGPKGRMRERDRPVLGHNSQAAEPGGLSPQQEAQAAATDLRPWRPLRRLSKFLGRKPSEEVYLWRSLADVSLPGPDLANFPNSSYTLPQGGIYLENSPVGFYGASVISTSQWNWEYLLRYGVSDNIELRLFSNGLSAQPGATGFSPLAFDTKAHLWAMDWDYFNISIGMEAYIQTTSWLASPAFNSPLQYAFNVLVDHELPWEISFEWNLGFVRQTNPTRTIYLPTFQWAFQRNVTDDIALFIQGYHNADALPRGPGASSPTPSRPQQESIGFGGQWTLNKRLAFYGSYNWGLTKYTPSYNANLGVAVSF